MQTQTSMETREPNFRPPSGAWKVPPDRHFSLDDVIPGPLLRGLVWIVRLPAGPIVLALLFGLIALPSALQIPTWDMNTITKDGTFGVAELPPLAPAVLLAALSAVLGAVGVAAPIGWLIVRRHLILGGIVTILIGWIAGIVALPVLPSLAGLPYGSVNGIGDPQFPMIVGVGGGIDVLSRFFAAVLIVSGLVMPLSLTALVLGVSIWAPLVRRRRT